MGKYNKFDLYEITTAIAEPEKFLREIEVTELQLVKFLSENGFQNAKTLFEEGVQAILHPLLEGFDIDIKRFSRVLTEEALRRETGFLISADYGVLMVTNRGNRLEMIHARDENQKSVQDLLISFSKTVEEKGILIQAEANSLLSKSVSDRLSQLSPSGKLLSEQEIREKARVIFDPKVRSLTRPIIEKTNGVMFSTDIAELKKDIGLGDDEFKTLLQLLLEKKILQKMIQIRCNKCGSPGIRTATISDVDKLVENVYCGLCHERLDTSNVEEIFIMNRDTMQIARGAWLEAFVQESINDQCATTWQGRFLGNDELDVVALVLGRILLFECKTTDIGHTEIYNLIIKSRRLGAHCLFVVATTKINENAKKAIEEFQRTEKIPIHVIEGDTDLIQKEVAQVIDHEKLDRVRATALQSIGMPMYRFRRYIREHTDIIPRELFHTMAESE